MNLSACLLTTYCLNALLVHVASAAVPADSIGAWIHIVDRLIDAVLHASFTGALVLVTLSALGVALGALWTVQLAVRALRGRTPKR
jgi:hypothetical protein